MMSSPIILWYIVHDKNKLLVDKVTGKAVVFLTGVEAKNYKTTLQLKCRVMSTKEPSFINFLLTSSVDWEMSHDSVVAV